jgi:uncharacterized secreted protein with C-terminal beta-propeller domain
MSASRGFRWVGVAVGAGLLVTAGCTSRAEDPEPWPAGELRLVSFDSCEQVEEELRAAASEHVGPWGFEIGGAELFARGGLEGDTAGAAEDGAAAPEAALAPDAAPEEYSGTNVHEAGVDEPDLVKTDGRRIVVIDNGLLRVVDAQRRVEVGTLDLRTPTPDIVDGEWWQPADLLLHGDRALVLMQENWYDLPRPASPGDPAQEPDVAPITGPRLVLVELSGAPRVLAEYTIDGSLVDARAVGQTARVVVRSGPRLALPELDETLTEPERTAANLRAIQDAPVTDWLPRYQVGTGTETDTGQVDCTAVSRPESYSGTSMLTVLSFDLASPELGDGAPVSVVADGDTVYSNGPSLYIASDQRWRGVVPERSGDASDAAEAAGQTEIYKFDTSGGRPQYAAAGSVAGWLLNQYSMSEWEEHLRVATTTDNWQEDGEGESESSVYTLAERGGELVVTGSVDGLGKTERIHSVRFTGPIGYVVTFRETDPLYTLDLRDPAAPAVLGELKITGYSAYLHPLGDGRLIGVGQEADLQGRVQGTQVSLFDTADLANPALLDTYQVPDGFSEAEFDPHAFLWWPDERLLVIPVVSYHDGQSNALLLRVEDETITELATTSHPGGGQITRSLVVGDTLWTVSDRGLQANALSSFTQTAWLPFA